MTLTLRSRLTLLYTVVFGVLLVAHRRRLLPGARLPARCRRLREPDRADDGLHGYLRFERSAHRASFDQTDPAQAAFVEEATRYYQVFDARTGELLVQSDALGPLGLEFTPAEVRQFGDRPVSLDVDTDYGRIRLSNSVHRLRPPARRYLLQVGVSLAPMDAALKRFLDPARDERAGWIDCRVRDRPMDGRRRAARR